MEILLLLSSPRAMRDVPRIGRCGDPRRATGGRSWNQSRSLSPSDRRQHIDIFTRARARVHASAIFSRGVLCVVLINKKTTPRVRRSGAAPAEDRVNEIVVADDPRRPDNARVLIGARVPRSLSPFFRFHFVCACVRVRDPSTNHRHHGERREHNEHDGASPRIH